MVGDTTLRKVVGTDLLRTVSGTDLTAAHLCFRIVSLLLLDVIQLGFQQCECLRLVLNLRLLSLAVYHDSGRIVGQTYCGVGGVDTLTTVTGCSHDINTDILVLDDDINIIVHLRHNCHTDGGGMDTSAALGLRHTLYTMYATLILHLGVSTLSADGKLYFLHTADTDLIHVDQFYLPTLLLGIMHIHTIDLRCKQCSLIAAGTCTDLHDYILVIIRILGQ